MDQRAGNFARHKLGAALNPRPAETEGRELVDSARDKRTGDIIDAEQLWDLEVVDKEAYECPGCGIQVFPASYRKNINKKRPYFTPMDNKHIQPCGVDGVEKLVKKAKSEKVGTPEGFPVPFPNRLRFDEERPVTAGGDVPGAGEGAGRTRTRANGERGAAYHGHTVKTIRPVCRVFMDFPNDRAQLPLEIPGCPGTTYAGVFRGLGFFGIEAQQPPTRLFCAALRWDSAVETDTYIEWALDAGEWPKGEKRPTRFYKVRVMWAEWTDRQRNTLREEIEIAKDAVKGKTGQPEKAWLFFVGTQDAEDATLFTVNRYPFICCRVGEMIWPRR